MLFVGSCTMRWWRFKVAGVLQTYSRNSIHTHNLMDCQYLFPCIDSQNVFNRWFSTFVFVQWYEKSASIGFKAASYFGTSFLKRIFTLKIPQPQCTLMFFPTTLRIVSLLIEHPPHRLPPFMSMWIQCTPVGRCSLHMTRGSRHSMPRWLLW